ncbi:MAG: SPOR domain-containing protein [Zoogloeaceae bacterium]|jgi:cell division protein FtsN|nr:SPOR domain-containing protein [Zoogloeaceae bacterium]
MKVTHYSRGGTLVGMFVGLVLGVVIAAGVVWYMNNSPIPFVDKATHMENAAGDQPPVALPGKPGDPIPDDKRFQFYDILPGKAEAVPGAAPDTTAATVATAPATAASANAPAATASGTPHFLQAGSFSNPQEADNLKATLAMNGYEANVQQVMVQDRTFYRLRLGPYASTGEISRIRAELAKSGVETILVNKE